MLVNLTVAIPVLNEERNLIACLQAIGTDFARQVVVIDSASSDSTANVANAHGAELITFQWDGRFPKKRNWYLHHHRPTTDWVLFLDADEILTPAVKREIAAVLPGSSHQGFLLSYTNYFLGRRLRGGIPLRKLSLFRVGEVEYEHIEEIHWSQCDMEVHEHPQLTGSVGLIRSHIDHRDLRGIESYMTKHNQYAAWEAQRLFSHRYAPHTSASWKFHQRIKYSLLTSPWGGLAFFFGSYLVMGGWRDGSIGLSFSMIKAGYYAQVACRFQELKQARIPPRS